MSPRYGKSFGSSGVFGTQFLAESQPPLLAGSLHASLAGDDPAAYPKVGLLKQSMTHWPSSAMAKVCPIKTYGKAAHLRKPAMVAELRTLNGETLSPVERLEYIDMGKAGAALVVVQTPGKAPVITVVSGLVSTQVDRDDTTDFGGITPSEIFEDDFLTNFTEHSDAPVHFVLAGMGHTTRTGTFKTDHAFISAGRPALFSEGQVFGQKNVTGQYQALLLPTLCAAPVGLYWPASIGYDDFIKSIVDMKSAYGFFIQLLAEEETAVRQWFDAVRQDPDWFVVPMVDATPLLRTLPTSDNPQPEDIIDLLGYDPVATMIMRWKWWLVCDALSTTLIDETKRNQWETYLLRAQRAYPTNAWKSLPIQNRPFVAQLLQPDSWPSAENFTEGINDPESTASWVREFDVRKFSIVATMPYDETPMETRSVLATKRYIDATPIPKKTRPTTTAPNPFIDLATTGPPDDNQHKVTPSTTGGEPVDTATAPQEQPWWSAPAPSNPTPPGQPPTYPPQPQTQQFGQVSAPGTSQYQYSPMARNPSFITEPYAAKQFSPAKATPNNTGRAWPHSGAAAPNNPGMAWPHPSTTPAPHHPSSGASMQARPLFAPACPNPTQPTYTTWPAASGPAVKPPADWRQYSITTENDRSKCPTGFLALCLLLAHDCTPHALYLTTGEILPSRDAVLPRKPCPIACKDFLALTNTSETNAEAKDTTENIQRMRQWQIGSPPGFHKPKFLMAIYNISCWQVNPAIPPTEGNGFHPLNFNQVLGPDAPTTRLPANGYTFLEAQQIASQILTFFIVLDITRGYQKAPFLDSIFGSRLSRILGIPSIPLVQQRWHHAPAQCSYLWIQHQCRLLHDFKEFITAHRHWADTPVWGEAVIQPSNTPIIVASSITPATIPGQHATLYDRLARLDREIDRIWYELVHSPTDATWSTPPPTAYFMTTTNSQPAATPVLDARPPKQHTPLGREKRKRDQVKQGPPDFVSNAALFELVDPTISKSNKSP